MGRHEVGLIKTLTAEPEMSQTKYVYIYVYVYINIYNLQYVWVGLYDF